MFDPGVDEAVGVVAGAGTDEQAEFGEVFLAGVDEFEDLFAQDAWYAESNGEGLWGLCD